MSADRVCFVNAVSQSACRSAAPAVASIVASIALCAGSLGPLPVRAAPAGVGGGDPAVTTIYRNTLPDGTVEFSDRPAAAGTGAANVGHSTYVVPDAADAIKRADAEREYWRQQAEGFDKRTEQREAQAAAAAARRAQAVTPPARVSPYDSDLFPGPVYYVQGRPVIRPVRPQTLPGAAYAPGTRPPVGSAVPFGLPYRPGGLSR
jgi:hypothetical protein